MSSQSSVTESRALAARTGVLLAALGVLCFSFTFLAAAVALRGFDVWVAGSGRMVLAGVLGAAALTVARVSAPERAVLRRLLPVGLMTLGALLVTIAVHNVGTAHVAVVIGLLPAATAAYAVWHGGERASPLFWLSAGIGAVAVALLALTRGSGLSRPDATDLVLLVALALGTWGYAEGGRLAREMPGWQVIAWGSVLSLSFAVPLLAWAVLRGGVAASVPAVAWAGLAYGGAVSALLGFVPWYRGMVLLGVARASQLQLAQPVLALLWAVTLLGERPGWPTYAVAGVVLVAIVGTQRSRSPGPA